MSIQESFEEFEQHAADLDRHASREKLTELHAAITAAWKLAREIRECGRLDMDSYGRLADVTAHLAVAEGECGRACSVEEGYAAQERSESVIGGGL
jgi:hypothetical protein